MISYKTLLPAALLSLSLHACAQTPASPADIFDKQDSLLRDSITHLIAKSDGHIGVAILDMETGHGCSVNGDQHFPMLSVYKFPLALYIFSHKGKFSTSDTLYARRSDWPGSESPIFTTSTDSVVPITVHMATASILGFSDNVACDLLFEHIGGPAVVNDYVHGLGIQNINIVATERQMAKDPQNMYRNWCTPLAMNSLLRRFGKVQLLTKASTGTLMQWMAESIPGSNRIKGLLPARTTVMHKTGTSATDPNTGITAATNDAGLVVLPNHHHLCITVFVSDSRSSEEVREHLIAVIARMAYDAYNQPQSSQDPARVAANRSAPKRIDTQ